MIGILFFIFLLVVLILWAIAMQVPKWEDRELQKYKTSNLKNRESILREIKIEHSLDKGLSHYYSYANIDEASDLLMYDLKRYEKNCLDNKFTLDDHKNSIFQEKIFLKIFCKDKSEDEKIIVEKKFNLINHENEINYLESLRNKFKFDNKQTVSNLEITEQTLLKRVRQSSNLKKFKEKFFIKKKRHPDISEISTILNLEKKEINTIEKKGEIAFQQIIDIYSNVFREKFHNLPWKYRSVYGWNIENLIDLTEIEKLWECFFISSIFNFNPFENENFGNFKYFAEIWIPLGFDKVLTPKIKKLYKQGKVIKNFNKFDIDIFQGMVFKNELQILNLYTLQAKKLFFLLFRSLNRYISFFNLCNEIKWNQYKSSKDIDWRQKMDFIRILFFIVLQIEDKNTNLRFFSLSMKGSEINFDTRYSLIFIERFDDMSIKLNLNEEDNERFFDDKDLEKSVDSFDN
tara:strand:+ start:432 stop:1811 length:1380 start_codon:yes stop_codon:yes gene_type:complete